MDVGESKILSRRKRYLIFPDGSSLQLVFCTQNHGYLQLGDIVWIGNTAALAWMLPTDPSIFGYFRHQLKEPYNIRRQDNNKHIYYLDEDGKLVAKVPYKRKPIINPAFAKRSIQNNEDENISIKKQVFIKKMHELQKSRSYLEKLDGASAHFHRSGRHSLYKKLETLFEAYGYSGRECVFRLLCDAGKAKAHGEQGTFLQELFTATFTLPKGETVEDLLEYDKAHNTRNDCAELYPECEDLSITA
ncbi:uncharacterized protein LOC134669291 [Cydia fagiglandana]|uniref:uncharacterized protein LOC134669291 n=1 Tax=Cydia fagiglandana TaxID=1458189 RepID=UPI002FEE3A0F